MSGSALSPTSKVSAGGAGRRSPTTQQSRSRAVLWGTQRLPTTVRVRDRTWERKGSLGSTSRYLGGFGASTARPTTAPEPPLPTIANGTLQGRRYRSGVRAPFDFGDSDAGENTVRKTAAYAQEMLSTPSPTLAAPGYTTERRADVKAAQLRSPAGYARAGSVNMRSKENNRAWERHGQKKKPLDPKHPFRNKADAELLRKVSDVMHARHASVPETHRRFFRKFDTDGDGSVDREEFKAGIKTMHLGLNEEELERCATLIDRNDTHTFDFSEFLQFVDSYQPLDSYGTEDPPWKVQGNLYAPWDPRYESHEYHMISNDEAAHSDMPPSMVRRGRGPAPRNFYVGSRAQESLSAAYQKRHTLDQRVHTPSSRVPGRYTAREQSRVRRGGYGVGGGSGGESHAPIGGTYPSVDPDDDMGDGKAMQHSTSYVEPADSAKKQQAIERLDMSINKALASKINGLDENKLERFMKKVFRSLDKNGDGTVQVGTELLEGLRINLNLVMSDEQNARLVELMDANGDGELDWDEFSAKVFGSLTGVLDKGGREVGSLGGESQSILRRPRSTTNPSNQTAEARSLGRAHPAVLKNYDAGTVPSILSDPDPKHRRELDALLTRVQQRPSQLQRNLSQMDVNGDGVITTEQAADALRRFCPEWGASNAERSMAPHRMETSSGKFSSLVRTAASTSRMQPMRGGAAVSPAPNSAHLGNPQGSDEDKFIRYPRRRGVEHTLNVCSSPNAAVAQGTMASPAHGKMLPEESVNAFASIGSADEGHFGARASDKDRGWHGNTTRNHVQGTTEYPDQMVYRHPVSPSTRPSTSAGASTARDEVDTAALLVSAADPENTGVVRYRDFHRFVREISEESAMHMEYRKKSNATQSESPAGFWGMRGYNSIQAASDAAVASQGSPASSYSSPRRTGPFADRHYMGAFPVPKSPYVPSTFKMDRGLIM